MDSASPSGRSNGPTPTSTGAPRRMRRPPPADPLRPRKKPTQRRPNNVSSKPAVGAKPANIPSARGMKGMPDGPPAGADQSRGTGAWALPEGTYTDYPLVLSVKELREGMRYHVAKFASKNSTDPSDESQFTRPVTLQRRRPNDPKYDRRAAMEEAAQSQTMDSKDREKMEILKAEREAKRAADQAQIAPVGKSANPMQNKPRSDKPEKAIENYNKHKTPAQQKEANVRFEESYAWYFDDQDNRNQWMGIYEAALSDCHVAMVVDGPNFRVIPVEKWYKFVSKSTTAPMTVDEVEAAMAKKHRADRWAEREKQEAMKRHEAQASRQAVRGFFTTKKETATFKNAMKGKLKDVDDLDFDADDLFQDDDETMNYHPEKNEEEEDAKERIKRDQLGANLFDLRDEHEVDEEEAAAEAQAKLEKELGKEVKKALRKREKNYLYDDSDYEASDSDSDEQASDIEKQKEVERKKAEEEKNKAKLSSKPKSGTSSKGNTTPSGRTKTMDALQKPPKTLKRSGSPNLSESSGNESTRKKAKKQHNNDVSGNSTPARAQSPTGQPAIARKSSSIKLNVSSQNSADASSRPSNPSPLHISDGEATAGEMSDGAGGKRTIKLKFKSGSPTGSRAGSPGTSRAGSPSVQAGTPPPMPPAPPRITSDDLLRSMQPGQQMTIKQLGVMFNVGPKVGQTPISEFVKMVTKTLCRNKDSNTFSLPPDPATTFARPGVV